MNSKITQQHHSKPAYIYIRHYSEFWIIPSALSLRGITYLFSMTCAGAEGLIARNNPVVFSNWRDCQSYEETGHARTALRR